MDGWVGVITADRNFRESKTFGSRPKILDCYISVVRR